MEYLYCGGSFDCEHRKEGYKQKAAEARERIAQFLFALSHKV